MNRFNEEVIAEVGVIGSCLVDERAILKAIPILEDQFFTHPTMRTIFVGMKRLLKNGRRVDNITVFNEFTEEEKRSIGGIDILIDLVEKVPSAHRIEDYAGIVRRKFFKRRLEALYEKSKLEPDDLKIHKEIRHCWDEILGGGSKIMDMDEGLFKYQEYIEARMRKQETLFLSGFPTFDHITGGLNRGDMVVVGARTSRGKTSYLIALASRYIERGYRTLIITAEMTNEQIMDRMISIRSKIPLKRIRRMPLPTDWPVITTTLSGIHKKPLFVCDASFLTMAKIIEAIQATRPDIVMVDYIQRFVIDSTEKNRAAAFSNIANGLKAMAKEKNIAVFVSSQLNRDIEYGKDREPKLADLKESGGIEEASDIVALIHSPENAIGSAREVSIMVAKNRNGALGKIPFLFFEETTGFEEKAEELETA